MPISRAFCSSTERRLAEEAGLSQIIARRRVSELAHTTLAKLAEIEQGPESASVVADIVRERCERALSKFDR